MNRFKTSKFHNAAAKSPKRENCYNDINVGSLKMSCGNHLKASTSFIAFNVDKGGCLGIIPLSDIGRRATTPLLHVHSDFVTDMDFSPFDDGLLATCSYDCSIKIWQIPESGVAQNHSLTPLSAFPLHSSRVENVLFHPTAEEVLASSCSSTVSVWDVSQNKVKFSLDSHKDAVQSLSWKEDGSLLVTSCKDKTIRIFDPRKSSCTVETLGFAGIKDSRVIWRSDKGHIIGTGFSSSRERQVAIWDIHNMKEPLQRIGLDTNTGTLMPFHDADSDMLLIAGKGDTSVLYFEIKDSGSEYLKQASVHMTEDQHKGMGMVPKLALDVMSCEVVRLLQLTKNSVVPISYLVPRKNLKDFNADLYPDTLGPEPAITAERWFQGNKALVRKYYINSGYLRVWFICHSKRHFNVCLHRHLQPNIETPKPTIWSASSSSSNIQKDATTNSTNQHPASSQSSNQEPVSDTNVETWKSFSGVRSSKFRHIIGVPMHKSTNIENIRNLSMSTFGECDGLQLNKEFVAYPLSGPGGQIAVLPHNKPCRLPDSGMPVVQCGSTVMDFVFDPLDVNRMAVACETGVISIWNLPSGGLTEILDEPVEELKGHYDKPNIVRYHPNAENLLTSAAYDLTVKLWDINAAKSVITLEGHNEQVFSLAWSADGKQLATFSRDKKLRIYDPRAQVTPVLEGPGPEGSRGGRVIWGGPDGNMLLVCGSDKMSHRTVSVYDSGNLSEPLSVSEINIAPSILIPFYDEDANVIMLSGKGDTVLYAYEVSNEHPYLFDLTHYRVTDPFQAIAFFDKRVCDVKKVEFARAIKLTKTNLEKIMFQVPRIKKEYFQDDLFPETRAKWEAAVACEEWLAGQDGEQSRISLRPPNMKPLSEAPKAPPASKKYDSTKELDDFKSDERRKEELVTAMVEKLGTYDEDPLPQDLMEGVDDDEWDD
ncbi:predicted protein [Nematostella vectensis]|uniref:Coronin n=1 Tax=Nematostella vectensis TaxID=45351 RepID=A7RFP3_NEMVE|nr:predicted protein [Nematostella vectensis]|eukprot:XP_001641819.1 predicted protein [Nematostella vectensis]